MRSRPIFITLEEARSILGDCADIGQLVEELLVVKHLGPDGITRVLKDEVCKLARILGASTVQPTREPRLF